MGEMGEMGTISAWDSDGRLGHRHRPVLVVDKQTLQTVLAAFNVALESGYISSVYDFSSKADVKRRKKKTPQRS